MLKLTRKNEKFIWTPECEHAFQAVKSLLISARILAQPDFEQQFILSTNASSYAIGAVLEQVDAKEKLRIIAYYYRSLQKPERNYLNYEREALAVHPSLKQRIPMVGYPDGYTLSQNLMPL
ncbi:Retrovirus-related Pol polyprotein from transposon [Smittium culicis]|uniref:Retrovirus-related Pol polyprotein from transposon n=1 Tax=Smittium culicis TaxID=133412 RepID=A0A1R1XQZ7_9FUNG|nr:Retrovirus-related Pol polyprotein from transposon [Smittium culicis]